VRAVLEGIAARQFAERAILPLIYGSIAHQLNKVRTYTFTPFSQASQFARAQLQMSPLTGSRLSVNQSAEDLWKNVPADRRRPRFGYCLAAILPKFPRANPIVE
jgi:hypothetical protein